MKNTQVARPLAYITARVNGQVFLQTGYLLAENSILRSHLLARVPLADPQLATLAEIGKRLGCQPLEPLASGARPDTILAWYRKLIARKFNGCGLQIFRLREKTRFAILFLTVTTRMTNGCNVESKRIGSLAGPAPKQLILQIPVLPPNICGRQA